MARHPFRRQVTRAAELHRTPLENNTVQARIAQPGRVAQAFRQGPLRRSGEPAWHETRRRTIGKYPPAEPGALGIGPLEAATLNPKLCLLGRRTKYALSM